eukprot:COSAG04_NODE_26275_length_297_cov_0.661616_1_plen_67_part_10
MMNESSTPDSLQQLMSVHHPTPMRATPWYQECQGWVGLVGPSSRHLGCGAGWTQSAGPIGVACAGPC